MDSFHAVEELVKKESTGMCLEEKRKILRSCHQTLEETTDQGGKQLTALTGIKLLSRDKQNLDDLVEAKTLDLLLLHAGIEPDDNRNLAQTRQINLKIRESQRCLNNLLLQSRVARAFCTRNKAIPGVLDLLDRWPQRKPQEEPELLTMDLKILFLITALCPETRSQVLRGQDGARRLLGFVECLLDHTRNQGLNEAEAALLSEVLKVLFNVTLVFKDGDEDVKVTMELVCERVHSLFTVTVENKDAAELLHWNCINLLTNVPAACTWPLLAAPKEGVARPGLQVEEFDGVNVTIPKIILDLLIERTKTTDPSHRDLNPSALSVLCVLSRHHREVRKYLRQRVLPPLRDMNRRPEEGEEARNRLCKLLTSPVDPVSTFAAEFLFTLCKESVSRMVKYTGYGNAAGLLARRGLMLGGKGENAANYSDEEDTDTEEYVENAHKVNPIIGCVESPKPSPFEGMSEEQKEYEAMKLVNLIQDLQNMGVVKPALPGEDGTPREVGHVLELQENLAKLAGNLEEKEESDND